MINGKLNSISSAVKISSENYYTGFILGLMKGYTASPESMKNYSAIGIASGQSYLYQVDLTPFKDRSFHVIHQKSVNLFEAKHIIKNIDME